MIDRYNVDVHFRVTVEAFDEQNAYDVACEIIGEHPFDYVVKRKAKKVKKVD